MAGQSFWAVQKQDVWWVCLSSLNYRDFINLNDADPALILSSPFTAQHSGSRHDYNPHHSLFCLWNGWPSRVSDNNHRDHSSTRGLVLNYSPVYLSLFISSNFTTLNHDWGMLHEPLLYRYEQVCFVLLFLKGFTWSSKHTSVISLDASVLFTLYSLLFYIQLLWQGYETDLGPVIRSKINTCEISLHSLD